MECLTQQQEDIADKILPEGASSLISSDQFYDSSSEVECFFNVNESLIYEDVPESKSCLEMIISSTVNQNKIGDIDEKKLDKSNQNPDSDMPSHGGQIYHSLKTYSRLRKVPKINEDSSFLKPDDINEAMNKRTEEHMPASCHMLSNSNLSNISDLSDINLNTSKKKSGIKLSSKYEAIRSDSQKCFEDTSGFELRVALTDILGDFEPALKSKILSSTVKDLTNLRQIENEATSLPHAVKEKKRGKDLINEMLDRSGEDFAKPNLSSYNPKNNGPNEPKLAYVCLNSRQFKRYKSDLKTNPLLNRDERTGKAYSDAPTKRAPCFFYLKNNGGLSDSDETKVKTELNPEEGKAVLNKSGDSRNPAQDYSFSKTNVDLSSSDVTKKKTKSSLVGKKEVALLNKSIVSVNPARDNLCGKTNVDCSSVILNKKRSPLNREGKTGKALLNEMSDLINPEQELFNIKNHGNLSRREEKPKKRGRPPKVSKYQDMIISNENFGLPKNQSENKLFKSSHSESISMPNKKTDFSYKRKTGKALFNEINDCRNLPRKGVNKPKDKKRGEDLINTICHQSIDHNVNLPNFGFANEIEVSTVHGLEESANNLQGCEDKANKSLKLTAKKKKSLENKTDETFTTKHDSSQINVDFQNCVHDNGDDEEQPLENYNEAESSVEENKSKSNGEKNIVKSSVKKNNENTSSVKKSHEIMSSVGKSHEIMCSVGKNTDTKSSVELSINKETSQKNKKIERCKDLKSVNKDLSDFTESENKLMHNVQNQNESIVKKSARLSAKKEKKLIMNSSVSDQDSTKKIVRSLQKKDGQVKRNVKKEKCTESVDKLNLGKDINELNNTKADQDSSTKKLVQSLQKSEKEVKRNTRKGKKDNFTESIYESNRDKEINELNNIKADQEVKKKEFLNDSLESDKDSIKKRVRSLQKEDEDNVKKNTKNVKKDNSIESFDESNLDKDINELNNIKAYQKVKKKESFKNSSESDQESTKNPVRSLQKGENKVNKNVKKDNSTESFDESNLGKDINELDNIKPDQEVDKKAVLQSCTSKVLKSSRLLAKKEKLLESKNLNKGDFDQEENCNKAYDNMKNFAPGHEHKIEDPTCSMQIQTKGKAKKSPKLTKDNKSSLLNPSPDIEINTTNSDCYNLTSDKNNVTEKPVNKLQRKSKDRARNFFKRIISESKISDESMEESYEKHEPEKERELKNKSDTDKNTETTPCNTVSLDNAAANNSRAVTLTKHEGLSSVRKSLSLMDMIQRYSEKSPGLNAQSENQSSDKNKIADSVKNKAESTARVKTATATPTVIYVDESSKTLGLNLLNSFKQEKCADSVCTKTPNLNPKKRGRPPKVSKYQNMIISNENFGLPKNQSENKLFKSSHSESMSAEKIPSSQTSTSSQIINTEEKVKEIGSCSADEKVSNKSNKTAIETEAKTKKKKIPTIRDLISSRAENIVENHPPPVFITSPQNCGNQMSSNVQSITLYNPLPGNTLNFPLLNIPLIKSEPLEPKLWCVSQNLDLPQQNSEYKAREPSFDSESIMNNDEKEESPILHESPVATVQSKKHKIASSTGPIRSVRSHCETSEYNKKEDKSLRDSPSETTFKSKGKRSSKRPRTRLSGSLTSEDEKNEVLSREKPKKRKRFKHRLSDELISLCNDVGSAKDDIKDCEECLASGNESGTDHISEGDFPGDDSTGFFTSSTPFNKQKECSFPLPQTVNSQVTNPLNNLYIFNPETQQLRPYLSGLSQLGMPPQNSFVQQYPPNCLVPYNPFVAANAYTNFNLFQPQPMLPNNQLNGNSFAAGSYSVVNNPTVSSGNQNSTTYSYGRTTETSCTALVPIQKPQPRSFKVIQKVVNKVRRTCSFDTHGFSLSYFSANPSLANLTVRQFYSNPLTLTALLPKLFDEESHESDIIPDTAYIFQDSFFETSIREVAKDYVEFHLNALYQKPTFKDDLLKKAFKMFPFRDSLYLSESFPKDNELMNHKDLMGYLSCTALLAILDECRKRKLV